MDDSRTSFTNLASAYWFTFGAADQPRFALRADVFTEEDAKRLAGSQGVRFALIDRAENDVAKVTDRNGTDAG